MTAIALRAQSLHERSATWWWLRPGYTTAVALAFVALYVGAIVLWSQPTAAHDIAEHGALSSTWLHGFMHWDGAWYVLVAQHGYSTLPGGYQPYAFFPLFPAAMALVHAALPMLSLLAAGLIVNVAAIVGGTVLIERSLPRWPRAHRLLAIAALLALPSAFFYVTLYSEAIFFFASALVVWGTVRPGRLGWAALGVVVATLDRPLGIALIIIVVAAVFRESMPAPRRLATLVLSALGVPLVLLTYWHVAGSPFAFASAQSGWTSLRTLGPAAPGWIIGQLNPLTTSDGVIFISYWELLLVALPLIVILWRHHRSIAVFAAVASATAFVLGGVGTQSRYLVSLIPFWIVAATALHSRYPRTWPRIMSACVVAGVACNLWMLSRFSSWVWAG